MLEKMMMKISVLLVLLIAIAFHAHALIHNRIPRHHKVRHKHNMLHFNDQHVNEIREAFDDYKSAIEKPKSLKVTYEDAIKFKSLRHHKKSVDKLGDDVTDIASDEAKPSRNFDDRLANRHKRVHSTESTTRKTENLLDNYDDEYDDSLDEKKNEKVQETETAALTLTDHKLETLGTREGVQRSFELSSQRNNQQEIGDNYDQATIFKRIRENIMRTKTEGLCRWPNKKILEMPQHAAKMYTPRKYVVYQCSDDTACCGSSEKTCVAKKSEEIVLWFHVRNVGSTGYESLRVQNHTECECLYRSRQLQNGVPRTLPRTTTTTERSLRCNCPSHFDAEIEDGNCGCFCRRNKPQCRQRHEGKEGFTLSDQRCIKQTECTQPHCLYGSYSSTNGRCPDRNEKIRRGFQSPKINF